MEEKSFNKNGFNFPKNNAAKAILWALYPIGVYFAASIVVGFVVAVCVVFMTMMMRNDATLDEYTSLIYSYSGIILVAQQAVTLAATLPIFLIHKKYLPKPEKKNTISSLSLGVMFALGCCAVIGILQSLVFTLFSIQDSTWAETQEILVSMPFILQIIATVVLAPIVEEIMFRGMIMNRLMSRFPKWVAVVVSAVAFGVFHLNFTQGIFATLTGLVFGFLYLKTRSILLCIFAHAANNLYATLCSQISWSSDVNALVADIVLALVMLVPIFIIYVAKRNKKTIND